MKITKEDRAIEIISLKSFGLTDEEIDGFFDFYEIKEKSKKFMVINSKGKK